MDESTLDAESHSESADVEKSELTDFKENLVVYDEHRLWFHSVIGDQTYHILSWF